jgi:hypothetical protein
MIRERPDVASKRDECRMALRALKDAVAALESLPADLISRINGAPAVDLGLAQRAGGLVAGPSCGLHLSARSRHPAITVSKISTAVSYLKKFAADFGPVSCVTAAGVAESEAPVAPRRTSSTNVSQFVVRCVLAWTIGRGL